MSFTEAELHTILEDTSKRIEGDINWRADEDHSPAVEFRAEVLSDSGYPLFLCGTYNAAVHALSFALIHRGVGRIYALDLGKEHHNPECDYVGETHKHKWTERFRDKWAYAPDDITATTADVLLAWAEFCDEAKLEHRGRMEPPPPFQEDFFV